MKKTISIVIIILTFLILYFLQANFFSWFTIGGIKPNLFIIFILFISLFIGRKTGIIFGILFGFYIDILIGKNIGITSFMFTTIAFIGSSLEKNFSKDNRFTIMLMVMASTAIYEIGCYIFNIVSLGAYLEILSFIKILAIEIIYNVILVIILYPIIQKAGDKLEETFKENKILTRYF